MVVCWTLIWKEMKVSFKNNLIWNVTGTTHSIFTVLDIQRIFEKIHFAANFHWEIWIPAEKNFWKNFWQHNYVIHFTHIFSSLCCIQCIDSKELKFELDKKKILSKLKLSKNISAKLDFCLKTKEIFWYFFAPPLVKYFSFSIKNF
jgi:hypothetical protein